MDDLTLQLIREKEDFRSKPYWDVTAWRAGYGSDTWTDEKGKAHKVTKDTVVTRDQAERDLQRRVPEFQQQGIIRYVGQKAWDALAPEARAAVTSVAYNYGSIAKLRTIKRAIVSGDSTKVATAIRARASDNGGVNKARRNSEADLIINAKPIKAPVPATQSKTLAAVRKIFDPTYPDPKPLPAPAPLTFGKTAPKPSPVPAPKPAPTKPVAGLTKLVAPAPSAAKLPSVAGFAVPTKRPPQRGVIKTTAPDQEPIPHDVVPQSVLDAGGGTGSLLTTKKPPVAGLIQLKVPGAPVAGALNGGGDAAAARMARMKSASDATTRLGAAQAEQARIAARQTAAQVELRAASQRAAAERLATTRAAADKAAAARAAALAAVRPAITGVGGGGAFVAPSGSQLAKTFGANALLPSSMNNRRWAGDGY